MATKVCPSCGAEYIAKATVCADCGVDLVEGPEVDPQEVGGPRGAGEQIAYELSEWSAEARTLLDQLMVAQAIPHVWESGTLVVDAASEPRTDLLVDQVEVSEQPTVDPDVDRIVYELEGWSEDKRSALADALTDDGIAHGWDAQDNLVVAADDQDHTDAVVDRIDVADTIDVDPEADAEDAEQAGAPSGQPAADGGDVDGGDAETVMSELFVSADRLMHRPKDRSARERLTAAATEAERLPLPYGIPRPMWDDLAARAVELRDLFDASEGDELAIVDAAKAVREHLRDYV